LKAFGPPTVHPLLDDSLQAVEANPNLVSEAVAPTEPHTEDYRGVDVIEGKLLRSTSIPRLNQVNQILRAHLLSEVRTHQESFSRELLLICNWPTRPRS